MPIIDDEINNVTVFIPLNVNISDFNLNIYGQSFEISGKLIIVNTKLKCSSFYDRDAGKAWIEYKQSNLEDDFRARIKDISSAEFIINDVIKSVYLEEGAVYNSDNLKKQHLDCSGVFKLDDTTWNYYNSLQDFIISYFAYKILGHPGALSAISNDSIIRSDVTREFPLDIAEIKVLEEDKVKSIVQQIMNQDLSRFNNGDKYDYVPLIWLPGDKIHIQIEIKDNTYTFKKSANDTFSSGSFNENIISSRPDYYILQFTLSDE